MTEWQDRLSEYIDGELSAEEERRLESELERDERLRATLAELRGVRARARALEDRPPARDLWGAIAARIGSGAHEAEITPIQRSRHLRTERKLSFTVPQLAAAAVALMIFSGGLVALLDPEAPVSPADPVVERSAPAAQLASSTEEQYQGAVRDLERALEEGRHLLDSMTVRVLEQNLRIIDRAIEDARVALEEDPASSYLNGHLAQTMRKKLELLRRANAMVVEASL